MDRYYKLKDLLSNSTKRKEWIDYYQKTDPVFNEIMAYCKHNNANDDIALELSIISILDQKIKTLTEREKMAYYMTRPLPTKSELNQRSYPEDVIDFGDLLKTKDPVMTHNEAKDKAADLHIKAVENGDLEMQKFSLQLLEYAKQNVEKEQKLKDDFDAYFCRDCQRKLIDLYKI